MTPTIAQLAVWRAHPNVAAFLRVMREGESAQDDRAYTMLVYGGHFSDFSDHPRQHFDIKTHQYVADWRNAPPNSTTSAAGVGQIVETTWNGLQKKYGFRDFTPATQELACVALMYEREAIDPLLAGDLDTAITRCRQEWTSLPGAAENHRVSLAKAHFIYEQYGGKYHVTADAEQPAAPIDDIDLSHVPPRVETTPTLSEGTPRMDPLTLISVFGPIISSLIPQVGKLFGTGEVATRNQETAKLVLDTVVKATGTPNVQAAVEAMQSDPAALQAATQAVLTEPKIMGLLEIGGGVVAARENDARTMQNDKPFYKTSAVFWVSVMLVPMVMWYVGSSIVGGIDIPSEWPWYAQLPLKLFGVAWDAGAKVGLANLVVGLVLGGICGVYYGISVTQQKQNGASEQRAP
jgi:muramidase (phage lysozyme)